MAPGPAQRDQLALAAVSAANDGLYRCGSDVVVPRRQREIIDLGDMEGFGNLLLVCFSVVTAAHDYSGSSSVKSCSWITARSSSANRSYAVCRSSKRLVQCEGRVL